MFIMRFILFFYAIITVFIAGGIFFGKPNKSNRALTIFLLLLGLEMLDYLYATSVLRDYFPQYYGLFYFTAGFFYGPALWFHFLYILYPKRAYQWKDLLHATVGVAITIYMLDIFEMAGADRINYMYQHFYDRIMPINYIRAGHILIYGIASLWLIKSHFYTLTVKRRIYAIAFCSIYFLVAVLISWLTAFADNWRQFVFHYLFSFSIVLIIGGILYYDPSFLGKITKKYFHSKLSKNEMDRIHSKILLLFQNDNIYTANNFKLKDLAKILHENQSYISQTMSELLGMNFNDFINSYRIKFAKKLLLDPNYSHFKIEAIAQESGFNTKVTFYKSFTKFNNISPAAYRKLNNTVSNECNML